jgi:hypothetical protein
MVLEQALGKIGLKPAFSTKFKEAVPKTEVLEQPQLAMRADAYTKRLFRTDGRGRSTLAVCRRGAHKKPAGDRTTLTGAYANASFGPDGTK